MPPLPLAAFVARAAAAERALSDAPAPDPQAHTTPRLTLYARNAVVWLSVRSWRADAKRDAIDDLKRQKAQPLPAFVPQAAREIADALRKLLGQPAHTAVTAPPCGHSRRPDCAGAQLAQTVALELGALYRPRFADRFVTGASHPRQKEALPPARLIDATPTALTATSGWHMEDALGVLRGAGLPCFGIAWISGTVRA